MKDPKVREYIWSTFITFSTAFLVAILPELGGLEMSQAAVFALLMSGLRAGVRALANLVATGFKTVSSK